MLPHGFVTDLSHRDLYRDEWVCVVSADNPAVEDELTVEHLRDAALGGHLPRPDGGDARPSRQMRMRGIEPNVQVVTENFLTVPGLVAGSDRIALLQRRLVELLPLEHRDPGAAAARSRWGQLVEAMWWHPVYDDDPEHAYLRDLVAAGHRAGRRRCAGGAVSTWLMRTRSQEVISAPAPSGPDTSPPSDADHRDRRPCHRRCPCRRTS